MPNSFFADLNEHRPADVPLPPDLLGAFGEAVQDLGRTLKSAGASFAMKFGDAEEKVEQQVQRLDALDSSEKDKVRRSELKKHREVISHAVGASPEKVTAWQRDIAIAEARLKRQAAGLESDASCLYRATLGDPNRATYASNLSGAGPAETRSAYEQALMTGDAALASALLSADGNRPKNDRVLNPQERAQLASRCLPKEVLAERNHVAEMRKAIDEAQRQLERITGQTPNPRTRIARGIRAGDARDGRGRGVVSSLKQTKVSER